MKTIEERIKVTSLKLDIKEMIYHHKNTNEKRKFFPKRRIILLENEIKLTNIMEENLNEEHSDKN